MRLLNNVDTNCYTITLFFGIIQFMRKLKIYSEFAFFIGLILLSAGVAFVIKSNLGISPVQSSAYILYQRFPSLTFGTYNYLIQLLLVIFLCILIKKLKVRFVLSFLSAVLYGFTVDLFIKIIGFLPMNSLFIQIIFFVIGFWLIIFGVTFCFRTNIPLMPYDIFVMDLSSHKKLNRNNVKIIFDISFLSIGIALSYIFFGKLVGIGIGTIISGLFSGIGIKYFGILLDKTVHFSPLFKGSKG